MNKRNFIKAAAGGCVATAVAPGTLAASERAGRANLGAAGGGLTLAAWRNQVGATFSFSGPGLAMALRLDRVDEAFAPGPHTPTQKQATGIEQFALVFSQPAALGSACAHPALASGACGLRLADGRSLGLFVQPAGQTAQGLAQWRAAVSRQA